MQNRSSRRENLNRGQLNKLLCGRLLNARRFLQNRLPRAGVQINLEISLLIYLYWRNGAPLRKKQVHMILGYSEVGVRNHLRKIRNMNWCRFNRSADDRRCLYVVPEAPLIASVEDYLDVVSGVRQL